MGSDFKKLSIVWEDEEQTPAQQGKTKEEEADFSTMLDQYGVDNTQFRVGEKVKGTISTISDTADEVLVELSNIHTGFIEKKQIINEHGELKYRKGDVIEAYIISRSDGSYQLSLTMERSRQAAQDLHLAMTSQMPVTGKVMKENKGGFEVAIFGKTAFCPVSQMDTTFVDNKSVFIGRDLEFLIEKIEDRGRTIVVSRAKLLKIVAERKLSELKASLKPDDAYDGVVKELRDYGAFVDIGGIDGFLHVSELSYSRIAQIRDFLTVGEKVRVKILSIEEKDGKTRVSLSMKAIDQDPWLSVQSDFAVSAYYDGRVTRLSKFGAFVEIKPGIEGLIHLSEMSWDRKVHKPEDVVTVGDKVKVRVLDISPVERRISLSLKEVDADPWHKIEANFPKGKEIKGKVERLKGYGAIVELSTGLSGFLPTGTLKKAFGEGFRRKASPPQEIDVIIANVDVATRRILLSLPQIESDEDDLGYQEYLRENGEKQLEVKSNHGKMGSFGALLEQKLNKGNKK